MFEEMRLCEADVQKGLKTLVIERVAPGRLRVAIAGVMSNASVSIVVDQDQMDQRFMGLIQHIDKQDRIAQNRKYCQAVGSAERE